MPSSSARACSIAGRNESLDVMDAMALAPSRSPALCGLTLTAGMTRPQSTPYELPKYDRVPLETHAHYKWLLNLEVCGREMRRARKHGGEIRKMACFLHCALPQAEGGRKKRLVRI